MDHIFFLHHSEHLNHHYQPEFVMAPLLKKTKPQDAAIEWVSTLLRDLLLARDDQERVEREGEVRSQ